MNDWPEMDRPPRNRRKSAPDGWDYDLEKKLMGTMGTTKAIVVPLWQFHSSPCKGRLWKKGFRVAHRVLEDKQRVAAWVLAPDEPDDETNGVQQELL